MRTSNPNNHADELSSTSAFDSYVKIAGVICLSFIMLAQLSTIGSTGSYFADTESSPDNFFVADPVYFTVEASTASPMVLGSEDVSVVLTVTQGELSDPIQYQVTAQMVGGDGALCNAIELLTTAPFPYTGPLMGFVSTLATQTGPWTLHASLVPQASVAQDTSCTVDLIYQAWNASSTPGQGYTDSQKVSLTFIFIPPAAPSAPENTEATSTFDVVPPDVSTSDATDSTSSPQVSTQVSTSEDSPTTTESPQ